MSGQGNLDPTVPQPRDALLDQTYPAPLEQAELELIKLRRDARVNPRAPANQVGLAFSGGGIRSATFAVGVLQALARRGLLGGFDYLSTVSGGGYAGSFLTRLFSRDYIDNVGHVAARLRSDRPPPAQNEPDPVEFLRENSRYLAPKAGGDLLLDAVVVLRNWMALQVVLATFFLMLLVGLQTLRVLFDLQLPLLQQHFGALQPAGTLLLRPQHWLDGLSGDLIHWSPWVNTLLPWWFCAVLPLGWVYWLIGYLSGPEQPAMRKDAAMSRMRRLSQRVDNTLRWTLNNLWRAEIHPLWGFFSVAAVHLTLLCLGVGGETVQLLVRGSLLVCAITFALYLVFLVRYATINGNGRGLRHRLWQAACDFVTALLPFNPVRDNLRIQRDARARNAASSLLAMAFSAWLGLILLSLVDSFGQTLYVMWREGGTSKPLNIGALFAALLALGTRLGNVTGFLTRVTARLGAGASFTALSGLAAWLLIVVVLSGADAIAQGIAWKYSTPVPMETAAEQAPATGEAAAKTARSNPPAAPAATGETPSAAQRQARHFRHQEQGDLGFCLLALGGLFLFSILFGRAWPFLNRSSQHPLYCDRLTRAYLGASNPERAKPGKSSITDPIPGDDGLCADCWSDAVFRKGAPLHLLNVTANETASTHGKTVFRDRKGIGMAAGPCGLSAGARHHALFSRQPGAGPDDGSSRPLPPPGDGYCMFGNDTDGADKKPERLTLGRWMAISGAAFSTGMGYHTTFALSVLTGFANLRLGYWWESGAIPPFHNSDRTLGRMLGHHVFHFLFPVQAYLMNELTASFHGPDEPHWYLSDGGSFENMGGYELIRRRLPVMVIVDGEEDPDYSYEGLANLVRKARMDFGAEIRFLTAEQIAQLNMPPRIAACFGHPEQLCPDAQGYSQAHAALANVRYAGAERQSLLIYLKPSLMRDVPADVREYQQKNKPFPQQPTANQFFDEAQWESYRRLGEYVASKVFADAAETGDSGDPAWHPALLAPPPGGVPG